MTEILSPAITALHDKITELAADATPEQLAYLGKAIESIGGRAIVLDVKAEGDVQIRAVGEKGETERQLVEEAGAGQ